MTNVPAATVVGVTLGVGVGRGAPEALLLREDGAIAVQEVVGVGEPDDGPVGEPEAGAALALAAGEGDGGAALALTAPADELIGPLGEASVFGLALADTLADGVGPAPPTSAIALPVGATVAVRPEPDGAADAFAVAPAALELAKSGVALAIADGAALATDESAGGDGVGVPLAFGAPTYEPLGAAEDTTALVSELAVAFAVMAKGVGAALIPAVDDALATDGAVAVSAAEVGTAVGVAVGVGLAVALGAAGAEEEVAELMLDGTAGGVGVSVGVALELETATLGIADARAELDAALVLDETVGGVGVG